VADPLTYVRNSWGHAAPPMDASLVAAQRVRLINATP